MKKNTSLASIGILIAIALATTSMRVSDSRAIAEIPTIRVTAGETIEVTVDTLSPKAEYSWILTKDRKFQTAARTKFFSTRLAQPGTYVLDVSIHDAASSSNDYRAISITVEEPQGVPSDLPPSPNTQESPLQAILKTTPGALQDGVHLNAEGDILVLDGRGSSGKIAKYSLDLNGSLDSNGDGNPENDSDADGTEFERRGTPLHVLVLPSGTERTMVFSVTSLSQDAPSTLRLPIKLTGRQEGGGQMQASGGQGERFLKTDIRGLTVTLGIDLNPAMTAGKQYLTIWKFGDGKESLLKTPTHTYQTSGTYTVELLLRDIQTGQEVWKGLENITVVGASETSASSEQSTSASASSAAASVSSSPTTSSKASGGFSVWSFIKGLLVILFLLGLALGAYAVILAIKKRATGKLQATLEKMEGTIVKKEPEVEEKGPEPMKLARKVEVTVPTRVPETITDSERSKTEFKKQLAPEAPSTSQGPVPAWLQPKPPVPESVVVSAVTTEKKPTAPTSAAAPSKPTSPSSPSTPISPPKQETSNEQTSSVESSSTPSAPTAPTSPTGPIPDWLKPKQNDPTIEAQRPKPRVATTPSIPAAPSSPSGPSQPSSLTKQATSNEQTNNAPPSPATPPSPPQPSSRSEQTSDAKASPPPLPKEATGDDTPIAIIQADSLNESSV